MDLIVDLFAGGGGASTAIFLATGRHPDVAVNHDPDAIDIHQANHPSTRHYRCDVREVDPVEACTVGGALRKIALLWASPDCTHHSRARGGKPVDKGIRSLATVVVEWLSALQPLGKHPTVIALENVEEFQDWGPVLENGQPCPDRKGIDFRRWVRDIEAFGYKVEWRSLVAADYGAPTTRKRLFLIARCDGEPIRWPDATHAPRDRALLLGKKPWRAAAEIINWNLPVPSIFARKKPLQPKTLARIAKGIKRFVVEADRPFIVPITHTGPGRVHDIEDPLRTITSANRGEFSLIAPTIVPRYGERPGQEPRVLDPTEPYPTVVPDGNGGQLAAASLIKLSENSVGTHMADPVHTVMAGAPRHGLVAACLERSHTRSAPQDIAQPAPTVTGKLHDGLIAACLGRQFGSTVSGRSLEDPHPAVMSDGGGGKSQVIAASLDAYYATGVPAAADDPLRTATAKARHGLTTAFMEQANTDMVGHDARSPVSTIVGKGCTQRLVEVDLTGLEPDAGSKRAEVLAFLWEHFGAPTEAERANPPATAAARLKFGLVVIGDAVWQIVDIGMRMLTPRELFAAQGFPSDYVIEVTLSGRPITKTSQTSMAGNSVSPPPAAALLRVNLPGMAVPEREAA